MQNLTIPAGFITSLAISLIAIPSIVKVARGRGLFGVPRGKNQVSKKIPTLGGLAIFAGIIISLNLYADIAVFPELPFLTAGALLLFFIGIKDDILIIAPWWKLTGQILVALVIAVPGGLRIHDPGSFVGLGPTSVFVETMITALVIVIIINSYNFIDGIDGLASGIGIYSSLIFGFVFYSAGLHSWVLIAAIYFGSLAGYAWFNILGSKNKIYMGDTGSLLLGFILSLMVIRFLNIKEAYFLKLQIHSPIAFILAVLIVPLFDILRVVLVRSFKLRSPLRPDRQHIHYRMIDTGLTHLQASGILMAISLILSATILALQELGEILLILLLLVISAILSLIPGYFLKRK
jgi:UDP-GlcNAc:undecaprenyl-phosphate/decaprenyl-phosphate GlcNAc-1-phosphate transferase